MSPVRFRPELKAPWQAIVAFAAAVYVLRSALRGWDFRPEVLDLVVFGALAAILLLRPIMARLLKEGEDTPDA